MQDDHPVWASMDALLTEFKDGERIASKYVGEDAELTPLEFLSACASQAAFMTSWENRVELLRAVKVAISQDRRRAFGFAESLFKELLNGKPFEEEGALKLISVFIEIVKLLEISVATQALLRCLYDPILTRIPSVEKAQECGKRIIDILEFELGTYTIQKLLLFSKFREREEIEEGSDTDASLTDWENTSDSTESSLNDQDVGCPIETSAAVAWIMAPNLIDPPVLSSFGRFQWAHRHARFLLNLPSNTLAANRGLELFASFDKVKFPKRIPLPGKDNQEEDDDITSEAYDTISAALRFASATESLAARDVIASFLKSIEPLETRFDLMSRVVKDDRQTPPIRGFAMDLIRGEATRHELFLKPAMDLAIHLLEQPSQEDTLLMASFSLLRLIGVKAKSDHVPSLELARSRAVDVFDRVGKIHRSVSEKENEIQEKDRFEIKHAHPTIIAAMKKSATNRKAEAPPGYFTPEARLGEARLIAGAAEPVLETWKEFLPAIWKSE